MIKIINKLELFRENINQLINATESSEIYDSFYIEKAFYPGIEGIADSLTESIQLPIMFHLKSTLNIPQTPLPSP